MRRFIFIISVVLSFITSAVGIFPPVVHAQTCPAGCEVGSVDGVNGCVSSDNTTRFCDSSSGTAANLNARAAAAGVSAAAANDLAAANRPLSFGGSFDKVIGTVMNLIMSIFAWLLGVAMVMLDYSVYYTVVRMGDYVQNLSGIGVAWRILRDLGNIALIFGFLAVGITTILNVDWYGGGKKFIPSLVIAAVLLNFSLFMTEAVIDTGNLFATQFYTQINGGVPAGLKLSTGSNVTSLSGVASVGHSIGNEVISQKIMSVLGLQTIYGAAIKPNSQVFKEGNITFISLMGIGLFMVAASVMFSLALILITRFVALIFIIILSPIGFAGYAIPQLASASKKWSDALVEQTITAPILLLLLYIALRVITDVNFLSFGTTGPDYLGFVQEANGGFNLQGLASAVLSFTVAMGLLLAVTYFSKKLGAMGGDWATKTAGKLSFGLTAAGMRSTAGFGFNAASRRFSSSKLARVPVIGRAVGGALNYGAKSNFDVRSTGVIQKLSEGKIDPGVAQKGGYNASEKARIKVREDYAKTLQPTAQGREEQVVAEENKKVAEKKVKEIELENEREMKDRLNKHKAALSPSNDRVDVERKALDVAKATGDQKTIATAQLAFNNALLDSQKTREEQNKERDELKKVHDQRVNVGKEEVEVRQKKINELKVAPKEEYARGLVWGPGKLSYVNSAAAKNILKEAKKSDSDKNFEKIQKFLEKDEEPKGKEGEEKKPEKKP